MKHFQDSTEATEFVDAIGNMLFDERLWAHCEATDRNFDADTLDRLSQLQIAIVGLSGDLESAGT